MHKVGSSCIFRLGGSTDFRGTQKHASYKIMLGIIPRS